MRALRRAARSLIAEGRALGPAVIAISIGLGLAAATYAILEAVLLDRLPFRDARRLVYVWGTQPERDQWSVTVSIATADEVEGQVRVLESVAPYRPWPTTLRMRDRIIDVIAVRTSRRLFTVLEREPASGRIWSPEELDAHVAVLSYRCFVRLGGGEMIGSALVLDRTAYTVIGVMPPGSEFPDDADLWVPLGRQSATAQRTNRRDAYLIARLRPDVTERQAQSQLTATALRLTSEGDLPKGTGLRVENALDRARQPMKAASVALAGAAAAVLTIACVNLAHVLVALNRKRAIDLWIRMALGEPRAQTATRVVIESVLLGLVATAVALPVAEVVVAWVRGLGTAGIPRLDAVAIDVRVVAVTLAAALVCALGAGVGSAIVAIRTSQCRSLMPPGVFHSRGVGTMVLGVEVASAVAVAIVAAVLLENLWMVTRRSLGVDPSQVVTAKVCVDNPQSVLPSGTVEQERQDAVEGVRRYSRPGGIVFASDVPFVGGHVTSEVLRDGNEPRAGDRLPEVRVEVVTPDWFPVAGVPLKRGRRFDNVETDGAVKVAVINESMSQLLWPEQEAVGKRFRAAWDDSHQPIEVIGIASNVIDPTRAGPTARMYLSANQFPLGCLYLLADVGGNREAAMIALAAASRRPGPRVRVSDISSLEDKLALETSRPRLRTGVVGAFAGIAILLVVTGTLAIVSLWLSRERKHAAIRIALGATRARLIAVLLARTLRPIAAGSCVGILTGWALISVIQNTADAPVAAHLLTCLCATGLVVAATACSVVGAALAATDVDPAGLLRES